MLPVSRRHRLVPAPPVRAFRARDPQPHELREHRGVASRSSLKRSTAAAAPRGSLLLVLVVVRFVELPVDDVLFASRAAAAAAWISQCLDRLGGVRAERSEDLREGPVRLCRSGDVSGLIT